MITSLVLALLESTQKTNFWLRSLFRLFPGFCLGDGLLQLSLCQKGNCPELTAEGYSLEGLVDTPMSPQVTGLSIVYLACEGVGFLLVSKPGGGGGTSPGPAPPAATAQH